MSNKLTIVRTGLMFAVGRSVGNVVTKAVRHMVPTNNTLEKIELAVGSAVIAGMVADSAVTWAGESFDETVAVARELKARLQENDEADDDN